MNRARVRPGRAISYNPTVAEAAVNGAGPWPRRIADVNVDGTVDLALDIPDG